MLRGTGGRGALSCVSRFDGLGALQGVSARNPTAPMVVIDRYRGADEVPDAELVRRGCAGEVWAREQIYRRYADLVAATARRLLRSSDEVEDVVHETFLIAFERMAQLLDPRALRGWLAQIAVRQVHRRFRRARFYAWFGGEDPTPSLEAQASGEASPEQRAELALVDVALSEMPLPLRTAWVLRRAVGLPLDEVAVACDCSLATVKRRIAEADARVARHVGGPCSFGGAS